MGRVDPRPSPCSQGIAPGCGKRGAPQTRSAEQCSRAQGSRCATRQSSGITEGGSRGQTLDPSQRSMANCVSLVACRPAGSRDYRLSLKMAKEKIMGKRLPPVHPGEVLRQDFLIPMKLSAYAVAKAVGVPRTRIERLVREETPVTADTALRLARYFGTTASFWMGLQAQYDLERAVDDLGKKLNRIEPLRAA